MGYFLLLFISVGLAMDAFAVSISNGICYHRAGPREAFKTALVFGGFQALMPLIGYLAGLRVKGLVESIDHWLALILLSFIGINMIIEGVKAMRAEQAGLGFSEKPYCTSRDLFVQGVATSIDALIVGVSFAMVDTNIVVAVILIGLVTFAFCLLGVPIGKKFGSLIGRKAEIVGGLILIAIGVKIFTENF